MKATYKTKAMTLTITFLYPSVPIPFYLFISPTQSNHHLEFQAHASFVMFLLGFVALSWFAQAAVTETIC